MGLSKSFFTKVAKTVFSVAGDAIKSGTYHQKGKQDYNPNTRKVNYVDSYEYGTGELSDQTLDHALDVFEEKYKAFQIDGQIIKAKDTKFICIQDDLAIEPKVNEWLTVENVKYLIVSIEPDPIKATWIFQCRV